jgi:hypothetical protein
LSNLPHDWRRRVSVKSAAAGRKVFMVRSWFVLQA